MSCTDDDRRFPPVADRPFAQAGPFHSGTPRVYPGAAMKVRSTANGAFFLGLAMIVIGIAFAVPSLWAIGCIVATVLAVCLRCLAMDLGHGMPRSPGLRGGHG